MRPGLRFKILSRDNFTCQYCGRSAPKVQLEVDHIYPKVRGGQDTPENLITACMECNRGKKDLLFNPNSNFSVLQDMRGWVFRVAKANLCEFDEVEFTKILNGHLKNHSDYDVFFGTMDECNLNYQKYIKKMEEYFECVREMEELGYR